MTRYTPNHDGDDLIQCLECGRWFDQIGSHLTRVHGIAAREYRQKQRLPASYSLASPAYRERRRMETQARLADGTLKPDPLAASEAARTAGRGHRTAEDLARQAEIARAIPHEQLPPGAKRADGRDADRAREAQRRRRAQQSANRRGD